MKKRTILIYGYSSWVGEDLEAGKIRIEFSGLLRYNIPAKGTLRNLERRKNGFDYG
jgi:hypothetical protein